MILTRNICRRGLNFHVTYTNPSGQTVGADEVENPWNRVVTKLHPLYPCSYYEDLGNGVKIFVMRGPHA